MKIILFSRQGVVHTAGDLHQMFDAIARFGFDYAVNDGWKDCRKDRSSCHMAL